MVRTSRRAGRRSARHALAAALAIAAMSAPSVARAQPAQADYAPAPPPASGENWEGAISPYVWFAGLKGEMGGRGRAPPVKIDTSFSDIADALKFGAMVMGQARRDRFVAVGDLMYVSVGSSRGLSIRDPSLVTGSLKVKQFTSTLAAGYRVIDEGPAFFDLLGGVRVTDIEQDFRLSGPNRSFTGGASRTLFASRLGSASKQLTSCTGACARAEELALNEG